MGGNGEMGKGEIASGSGDLGPYMRVGTHCEHEATTIEGGLLRGYDSI